MNRQFPSRLNNSGLLNDTGCNFDALCGENRASGMDWLAVFDDCRLDGQKFVLDYYANNSDKVDKREKGEDEWPVWKRAVIIACGTLLAAALLAGVARLVWWCW
jgi:hypothetical protein